MKPQAAIALLLIVSMLLGCRSTTSGTDPFMRQTMIPPPATGSYSRPGANGQPYYSSLTPEGGVRTASLADAGSPAPRLRPVPFDGSNPTSSSASAAPRSVVINRNDEGSTPRPSGNSSDGYTDIASLPVARDTTSAGSIRQTGFRDGAGAESAPGANNLVWQSPLDREESSRVEPASYEQSEGASRYGYADDYHWLRGRLEFSESHKQWKLRYIPIDGMTDGFGGSVVLEGNDELADYQHGDFVEIEGTLGDRASDAKGFAPRYALQSVRALQ